MTGTYFNSPMTILSYNGYYEAGCFLLFRIALFVIFILGALFFGDLRNWSEYYTTILYYIICSLLYTLLFHNYPLWKFEPLDPMEGLLPNNTLITLAVTFIIFPSTALIYLSNYPAGRLQYPYILLWVIIYSIIEAFGFHFRAISYHNGWNYWYSVAFNFTAFILLRLHHANPLLTWGISIVYIILFCIYFRLPLETQR